MPRNVDGRAKITIRSPAIARQIGRPELGRRLARLRPQDYAAARDAWAREMESCVRDVLPDLALRVPRLTGQLRASVFVTRGVRSVTFGFRDPKAPFVKFKRGRTHRTVQATLKTFARSRAIAACKREARATRDRVIAQRLRVRVRGAEFAGAAQYARRFNTGFVRETLAFVRIARGVFRAMLRGSGVTP